MKMRIASACFLLLLLCGVQSKVLGQFDPIPDTTACGFYIVENYEGVGLSNNIKAYTNPFREDPSYVVGDSIFTTSQVFVYDCDNLFDDCFFLDIIDLPPAIGLSDTLRGCNLVTLPVIQGDFITPRAAYFSEMERQGKQYYAGNIIEESTTLYISDGIGDCAIEKPLYIEVLLKPFLDPVGNQLHCTGYVLPAIEGLNVPEEAYYKDINTGQCYLPGDIVTSSSTIAIVADAYDCEVIEIFNIKIGPQELDLPSDTTVCGVFNLDLNLYGEFLNPYYQIIGDSVLRNAPFGNISEYNRTLDYTLYILDSVPDTDCQNRYYVNVEQIKQQEFRKDTLSTTINVCLNTSFNLHQLIKIYTTEAKSTFNYFDPETGIEIVNLDVSTEMAGNKTLLYITDNEDCAQDTMIINLNLVEECDTSQIIILNESCKSSYQLNYLLSSYNIPYKPILYDPSGQEVDTIKTDITDTLIYLAIYEHNTSFDTIQLKVAPFQATDLNIREIYGDSSLCNGETVSLLFSQISDTILLWGVNLHRVFDDTIIIEQLPSLFTDPISIGYNTPGDITIPLEEGNRDFFIEFTDGQNLSRCYTDISADTFYFNTLNQSQSYVQGAYCPEEIVTIADSIFTVDKPNGTIILEGGGSYGCDSSIIVNLTYFQAAELVVTKELCDTSEIFFFDCVEYGIDNPIDTIILNNISESGCDSFIYINLNYHIPEEGADTILLCKGESYTYSDNLYMGDTIVVDTLLGTIGCDSLYLTINIKSIEEDSISVITDYDCYTGLYTVSTDGIDVLWSTGDSTSLLDSLVSGQISFSYIYAGQCTVDSTVNLPVHEPASVQVDSFYSLELNSEILIEVDTSDVEQFFWKENDNLDCTLCLEPNYTAIEKDTLCFIYENKFGCKDTALVDICVFETIKIDTFLCSGDSIIIHNEVFENHGEYERTIEDKDGCDSLVLIISIESFSNNFIWHGDLNICTDELATITLSPSYLDFYINDQLIIKDTLTLGNGSYHITGLDSIGCPLDTIINIVSFANPTIIIQDTIVLNEGEELTITPIYTGEILTYNWLPRDVLSCSDCPTPTAVVGKSGSYTIEVEDENGCTAAESVVLIHNSKSFYFPNIINRLSQVEENQILRLISDDQYQYSLKVYDRWGNLHYDQFIDSQTGDGWAPKSDLFSGVYVFIAKVNNKVVAETVTVL